MSPTTIPRQFRPRAIAALSAAALCIASHAGAQPAAPAAISADSVETLRNGTLAPADTRADLATLDRAYRLYHPGLTRYQPLPAWQARVLSLHRWFGEPRGRGETYLALSELVASIRDSHTYLNFYNQPKATRAWLSDGADKLPFTFTVAEHGHWVVTRSAAVQHGILPGDTILALNGRTTPELTRRMIAATRADGGNDGKRRALLGYEHHQEHETSDVLLPLLAPPVGGRYTVRVRRPRAEKAKGSASSVARGRDTVVVTGATSAIARNATASPVPGPRAAYTVTHDGDTSVLTVDGFALSSDAGAAEAWSAFLRETFLALQQRATQRLILDLRRNEGGSDDAAALLLSHLITQPVEVPPLRRYVIYDTVLPALRRALKTWDPAFYDRRGSVRREPDGTFTLLDRSAWPDSILPSPLAFRGRIAILTSPVNSSASHILLRMLPRRENITLVGTETGGSLWAHTGGNLFFLALERTGFEADIPLIAYQWDERNPRTGVQPDVRTASTDAMRRARELLRREPARR